MSGPAKSVRALVGPRPNCSLYSFTICREISAMTESLRSLASTSEDRDACSSLNLALLCGAPPPAAQPVARPRGVAERRSRIRLPPSWVSDRRQPSGGAAQSLWTPSVAASLQERWVALCGGLEDRFEVRFILVGVGLGETRQRLVEDLPLAEVGGDGGPVAGAGMGPCQGFAAEGGIDREVGWRHPLDFRRGLAVPQLPHVEAALLVVDASGRHPAEEDVARRLHQPLPLDHPAAVVAVGARAGVGLQHRRLRFLRLQEEWIVGVFAEQQHDPS